MGLAGFLFGIIQPSRDMLVRKAAPPGAAGRVFGIVSTGFNIGGIFGPLLFGWLMDNGAPRGIFVRRGRVHGRDSCLCAHRGSPAPPAGSDGLGPSRLTHC